MTDDEPMPFGKYNGTPIGEVPATYLDWLRGQDWLKSWPTVEKYIRDNESTIDWELERGER